MDELPDISPLDAPKTSTRVIFRRGRRVVGRLWRASRVPSARILITGLILISALACVMSSQIPDLVASGSALLERPFVRPPAPLPTPAPTELDLLRQRPLEIPSLAAGAACPTTPAQRVVDALAPALGDGPVYAVLNAGVMLSYVSADNFYSYQWGGQRTYWVVPPGFKGQVLVRGRQVGGANAVGFGNGVLPNRELDLTAPTDTIFSASGGWAYATAITRVRAPGCYAFQVDGATFSLVIVFRAEPLPAPPPA